MLLAQVDIAENAESSQGKTLECDHKPQVAAMTQNWGQHPRTGPA